jgi:single-strand DNA-binding protein
VVRNKAAEICEKYLSKGDKIYVEGRIKSRQWQTEEGVTKYTTEIQVTEFTFLNVKKEIEPRSTDKNTGFDGSSNSMPDNNDMPF